MKKEYMIKYITKIPFKRHVAANSIEDVIRYIKKFDENGEIYNNYENGIDTIGGESVEGIVKNEIISINEVKKEKIKLDGIV